MDAEGNVGSDPADQGVPPVLPSATEIATEGGGAGQQASPAAPAPEPGAPDRGLRLTDVLVGVGVLVVLVLAGAVLARVLGADDEGGDGSGGRELAEEPTDTFDRPADAEAVGTAANGDAWDAVAGVWGVDGSQAYLAVPAPNGAPNFVTLDMGSSDGTVAVTFATVRLGTGLVFRFAGPDDYWVVVPATGFGTWVVQHRIDGEPVFNENVGLASSAPGTQVTVTLDGASIEVQIDDGAPVAFAGEPTDTSRVGLWAQGFGTNEARWDDFYAIPT